MAIDGDPNSFGERMEGWELQHDLEVSALRAKTAEKRESEAVKNGAQPKPAAPITAVVINYRKSPSEDLVKIDLLELNKRLDLTLYNERKGFDARHFVSTFTFDPTKPECFQTFRNLGSDGYVFETAKPLE